MMDYCLSHGSDKQTLSARAVSHSSYSWMHSVLDLSSWSVDDIIMIFDSIQTDHPELYQQFRPDYFRIITIINENIYLIERDTNSLAEI
jgi:hypothetical protein